MSDRELVIKIPEEEYINIKDAINSLIENGVERVSMSKICLAILDGTPLPKGHGELVDYEELKSNAREYGAYTETTLSHIKPKIIIEADTPKRRKGTPLEENDSGYDCEDWIP